MNWQPIETAPKDGSEILASVLYEINDKSSNVRETFFIYWATGLKKHPEGIWSFYHDTPPHIRNTHPLDGDARVRGNHN